MAYGNFRSDGPRAPRGGFGGRSGGGFRGGFRRSFGPREMTKIKCSTCGKEDEVPFKPREGTPVYCKDCYFKSKGITPRAGFGEKKKAENAEASEEEFTEEADETSEKEEEF